MFSSLRNSTYDLRRSLSDRNSSSISQNQVKGNMQMILEHLDEVLNRARVDQQEDSILGKIELCIILLLIGTNNENPIHNREMRIRELSVI